MDRIHIWSDEWYGSTDFLSTIPTPTHGLKVKVTDLEVYSWSLQLLKCHFQMKVFDQQYQISLNKVKPINES